MLIQAFVQEEYKYKSLNPATKRKKKYDIYWDTRTNDTHD